MKKAVKGFAVMRRNARIAVLPALFAVAACFAQAPANSGFTIGTNLAFDQHQASLSETVAVAKQAGIVSVRGELYWNAVELAKGDCRIPEASRYFLKAATAAGIAPLAVLGGGSRFYDQGGLPRSPEAVEGFARYAEFCVSALKGQCRLFQIGNAWAGGDDPDAYVKLIRTVYPRMKAVDPAITVLASGAWGREESPGKEGDWDTGGNCDGLGLQFRAGGGDGIQPPEACLEQLKCLSRKLAARNRGKEIPLYITGMDWAVRQPADRAAAADFVARAYLLAKTVPFIKGMWWPDFQDGGRISGEAGGAFGLVHSDLTPNPVYFVLKDLAPLLAGAQFAERLPAADPEAWALLFKGVDGKEFLALWCTAKDDACQFTFATTSPAGAKLLMTVLGETSVERSQVVREWVTKTGLKPEAKVETNRFSATVRGRPLLVAGDLSGLALVKTERHFFPEDARPRNRIVSVPQQVAVARFQRASLPAPAYVLGTASTSGGPPSATGAAAEVRDARFWVRWNRDRLQMVVEVAGAALLPSGVTGREWRGEGLRLAFQLPSQVQPSPLRLLRFSLRPAPGGVTVFRQAGTAASGAEPVAEAKVSVTHDGRWTRCVLDLPASSLGAPALVSDQVFGFALEIAGQGGEDGSGMLCWGGRPDAESGAAMSHWLVLEGEP